MRIPADPVDLPLIVPLRRPVAPAPAPPDAMAEFERGEHAPPVVGPFKAGDIVEYCGQIARLLGKRFRIVGLAPAEDFRLPNGQMNVGCPPGHFIVEVLGEGIDVRHTTGGVSTVNWGTGDGAFLRLVSRPSNP